ncbi:MAG: substrate-binding domain-containing protein, partial [Lentilactobacillus hilgardii]
KPTVLTCRFPTFYGCLLQSIISVDGTELCELVRPNLTSVTQSFYEMGTLGVRYLIESNQDDHYKKFTGLKIEERQSTKRNGKILG